MRMDLHGKRPTRSAGRRRLIDRAVGFCEDATVTFGIPAPSDTSFDSLLARIDEADRRWREAAQTDALHDPAADV